jgi:flagellar assembly factor FliW
LEAASKEEISIFVIVTIPPGEPENMTANLLGPLVVNTQTRLARQLVLDERRYSHRYPILAEDPQRETDSTDRGNSR